MKKILLSISMLAFAGAVAVTGTGAFFSDSEVSSGNTFTAGAIDLLIDNTSYYNGQLYATTTWTTPANLDTLFDHDNNPQTPDLARLFFNFDDLKPGDWGEDTISIHVDNNPAYACMAIDVVSTDDPTITEPEADAGDITLGANAGELQNFVKFMWWADDGDNVYETCQEGSPQGCVDEQLFSNDGMTLADLEGFNVALADSTGNGVLQPGPNNAPLDPNATYYVGKAWCFGNMVLAPEVQDGLTTDGPIAPDRVGTGFTCDGSGDQNIAQTDSVLADVSFYAVQSRNNDGFVCEGGGLGCVEEGDIMLVVDTSGSIGSTNMESVKTALLGLVDGLSAKISSGAVHIGLVSFNSGATLDVALGTNNEAAIDAAIALLASGGATAMGDAIDLADDELQGANDTRPAVQDYIVLVTDGVSNTGADPVVEATAAKGAPNNAEIFAVGIGGGVDVTTLQTIASDPDASHYFAADFATLQTTLLGLLTCAELPVVAP